MSGNAVARAYGRALFEAAREAGDLARVLDDCRALEQALATDLHALLLSPRVPMATRLSIVRDVFAGASPLFMSFLELVIRRGRAGALAGMVAVVRGLDDAAAGRASGQLRSAVELSEPTRAKIKSLLGSLTGLELTLEERQDPELLGGFVARVGDRMLDLSLRTRLDQLRRQLKAV